MNTRKEFRLLVENVESGILELLESKCLDSVNLGFTLLVNSKPEPIILQEALDFFGVSTGKNYMGRVTIKYNELKTCFISRRRRKMKKSTTLDLVRTTHQDTAFLFKYRFASYQSCYRLSNLSFSDIREIKIK
jgi:hypothetical protein